MSWEDPTKVHVRPLGQAFWPTNSREKIAALVFGDILDSICAGTEKTASQFTQVTDHELDQLWRWNSPLPARIDRCVHDYFVENAQRHPDKQAVVSWDGQLSYGQVNRLSCLIAAQLIELGVVVGTVIPLCFEKSIWTVVAAMAVLRAGGSLALTDPSQPEDRLRTIITEVKARHLMTSHRQVELALRIASTDTELVVVGPHLLQDGGPTGHGSQLPDVPPSTTLYIQFTSGSTGKPKGVVISHSQYLSGAIPRAEIVGYTADSRVLDFPSYAFDVSFDCMFCTLAVGGTICEPSEQERLNDINGAIKRMNVNMAHMTPSVARVLNPEVISSLDVLGLGGEAVTAGDAARWGRQTRMIIAYGPSECTVGCSVNGTVDPNRQQSASIGKGVGGSLWVVDPENHNRLVPIGAVGELLVEGPIVGDGYLNNPELTSEVFIEDPQFLLAGNRDIFSGRRGRLYKTGDLVRYDFDETGSLVFSGRRDQQVKIRGQRVELGEIEYHLKSKLPQHVTVAAETIVPKGGNDPVLVAFIGEGNGEGNEKPSFSAMVSRCLPEMNAHLSKVLPRYMVPTTYIPLHSIPMLVSCKTDRKTLRLIGSKLSREDLAALRAVSPIPDRPMTDIEVTLSRFWKDVLVLGDAVNITPQDDFFTLGGDSLKSMKMVASLRTNGSITLTVGDIFSKPVLADMASAAKPITKETSLNESTDIPPFSLLSTDWTPYDARAEAAKLCRVDESRVQDVYPCSPLQEGFMALSAKVSGAYAAQRVVELPNQQSAAKLHTAFDRIVSEHPVLRTRIVQFPGRGLMQAVIEEPSSCRDLGHGDLQTYLVHDREQLMEVNKPLSRVAMIHDEPSGKVYFVWTIHHALYDGWSMPLIVRRINEAYRGEEKMMMMTTTPTAPYKAFIKTITTRDSASRTYWRHQLRGAVGRQFPVVPVAGYQAQAQSLVEHYVPLPSKSSTTTIANAIRGAWALTASVYASSDDVIFGETLTGRNAPVPGIEEIEGPTITTVPVRIRVNKQLTVAQYLRMILMQTGERIPHEHLGLQHIRRVSLDAREACNLSTGIVVHPPVEEENDDGENDDRTISPANGFIPANDVEAAREALNFNSFGLMLVFSLDTNGFLIMASLDSHLIDVVFMQEILQRFGQCVQQMCELPEKRLSELDILARKEENRPRSNGLGECADEELASIADVVNSTWIVDPADPEHILPLGAVGELLVQSINSPRIMEPVESVPSWLPASDEGQLYHTDRMARYRSDGSIMFIKAHEQAASGVIYEETDDAIENSNKDRKMARLWSRILDVSEESIHPQSSFFDLGGDSIMAMRLVSEAKLDNLKLSVKQIFKHRVFGAIVGQAEEEGEKEEEGEDLQGQGLSSDAPFSLLSVADPQGFVSNVIEPALSNANWQVVDAYPVRPLQKIAVDGTVQLPRYSARYETIYFDSAVDVSRLQKSCDKLIARNEILRTVFVENDGACLGVVLQALEVPIATYEVDSDVRQFVSDLCGLDVQTKMPLGSAFIKFFLVRGHEGRGCFIIRISHSQYDEICLPQLLQQLSALYEDGTSKAVVLPFSTYVRHVVRHNLPQSIPYWRQLLAGSTMTVLPRPQQPVTSTTHYAISREVNVSGRPNEVTAATLPTAAWALCLARRLSTRDVVFGEVVSGRNIGLFAAEPVIGPCWQYVPVRVQFEQSWTGLDLLRYVQQQHVTSASYEGIGLSELIEQCAPSNWAREGWFDSVVHQDVRHVETLPFASAKTHLDTIYPHQEPLREWKIQAFAGKRGKEEVMTLEIITVESWQDTARQLLDELEDALQVLVREPEARLFERESSSFIDLLPQYLRSLF